MPQRIQAKARKHTPGNLSPGEAIEPGTKLGALIGLGIEGEEGMEADAAQAARGGHQHVRRCRQVAAGRRVAIGAAGCLVTVGG
jgi:hypothetical protein